MPIRPELRKFYGAAWREYRAQVIAIYGTRCSVCRRDVPEYLNLAHLTHDPRQSELVALKCPACHGRGDAAHALAVRRRTMARRAGQLWLLPELEWAPFANWMIPARVLRAGQGRLF